MTRNCPDCEAKPGELHQRGCDVERCARCGCQAITCSCIYEVCGIDYLTMEKTHPEVYATGPTEEMDAKWEAEWGSRRIPWTDEWPGVAECREFGFWAVFGPDLKPPQIGWVSVPVGTPGATEDLDRLHRECVWDQKKRRWIRKEDA